MESPSEGHEVIRIRTPGGEVIEGVQLTPAAESSITPDGVFNGREISNSEPVADGDSPEEIERGAAQTIAYYEAATGQKITMDDDDGETIRILHELSRQRSGWSETMERDALASLQHVFPDRRGSSVIGPL